MLASNIVFPGMEQSVSSLETECFPARNTLFAARKHFVCSEEIPRFPAGTGAGESMRRSLLIGKWLVEVAQNNEK